MSSTINLSEDGTYIFVKVHGEINRQLAMQQNLEAHALGAKLNIHLYLVDLLESQNTDSVVQNYNFAYQDMKMEPGIDRFARVAMIVRPDDHSHDFVEVVLRNAGQNVRIFTDRAAAMDYLFNRTHVPERRGGS